MIKLIICDWDGTLCDSRSAHFTALNEALQEIDSKYVITTDEHLNIFDGMTTVEKLKILSKTKNLPPDLYNQICEIKKNKTYDIVFSSIKENETLIETFRKLKAEGYRIYVGSNADSHFVKMGIYLSGLTEFIDYIVTRDDVKKSKPSGDIYMKCMLDAGVSPKETLILEDSLTGFTAAVNSGGNLMVIEKVEDVTYQNIKMEIEKINAADTGAKWYGRNVNVVIPMAGAGSRFAQAGYKLPKPMIDVLGKPMIQVATEYLNLPNAKYTFIVQKRHNEEYNLKPFLSALHPGCNVVEVDGLTEGAACTVLLAKEFINDDNHLIIANCDQYIDFDITTFMYSVLNKNADGAVLSFLAEDMSTKWSYAKVDEYGWISEIAEKKPISTIATSGVYHFRKGRDFVRAAEQMIEKKIKHNNEYYVAPVYNELTTEGAKILNIMCKEMWGLGTPSDLTLFIEKFKK